MKAQKIDRLAEAARYYANAKEADRLFEAGVQDETGATIRRVEGRFAHEWLSLAWSTARHFGFTHDEVRAAAAL